MNGGPPEIILREPDYNIQKSSGFFALGCGGSITVRFTDNALVDIEGPDLYIFEIGTEIEATQLDISKDGEEWIRVGEINGGTAEIDIRNFIQPGDVFYYVRLTDLKGGCHGAWPGADIDAIAAIGSVVQVTLSSSFLFDTGSYTLRTEALQSIDSIATILNLSAIRSIDISGHTDNVGSNEMNMTLSNNRANAVKEYLQTKLKDKSIAIYTAGFGETQPIATNDTEEGRQTNRRVTLIVHPKQVNTLQKSQFEELTHTLFLPYDTKNDQWFSDYPKPVNKKNFNGLLTDHLDDALYYKGNTYFFYGNQVKKYNNKTKVVSTKEQTIQAVFPGLMLSRIDASVYLEDEDVICFFKNDSCTLYKPVSKQIQVFQLNDLFPGIGTRYIDAVMQRDPMTFIFFFDGMNQVYNHRSRTAETAPILLSKENWGNLWLDGPDAIMDDNSGMMYFFKNPGE